MSILNKFDENPLFKRLGRRGQNFRKMVEHVDYHVNVTRPEGRQLFIIETGTAWCKDNWEYQGQSTLIWDWLCAQQNETLSCISIDLLQEHIDIAKAQTKYIQYKVGDSVKTLSQIDKNILQSTYLLYLDSFDWQESINMQSAFHHIIELVAVYSSLPSGCMIAVDDRHGDGQGKHWFVEAFMTHIGLEPVFKNHQIGWVKE